MGKSEVPARKMTYEEFLEWCDEDTWAEWVDGEVVVLSPASLRHQDVRGWLASVIRAFAEAHDSGIVLTAPFQMHLANLGRGREPDLLFISKERRHLLKETHLDGPADLVVEIVSPESRLRDRGEKFAEYEAGGVREYWIIDPDRKEADFYLLDARGRYRLKEADPEGIYRSQAIPGFWLKVDWLWQEPLPPVPEVLRELGLI